MITPARTLKDVFRAASLFPLESGDPRYVDCTEVRGDENAVKCMADRIERREGEPITQLFTGHMGSGKSTELQGLRKTLECHMVYTVPLSMLLTPKATILTGIFPSYCILPIVKVRERGEDFAPGYETLRELIARRISIEEVFSPGVVEFLIDKSGGSFRDLLRSIQYCCEWASDVPISRPVAERAVGKIANEFRRAIPEHHYPLLAQVHRTNDVRRDAEHQRMLYNTSVLEYTNEELWYDVHPAILQLPRFKEALAHAP